MHNASYLHNDFKIGQWTHASDIHVSNKSFHCKLKGRTVIDFNWIEHASKWTLGENSTSPRMLRSRSRFCHSFSLFFFTLWPMTCTYAAGHGASSLYSQHVNNASTAPHRIAARRNFHRRVSSQQWTMIELFLRVNRYTRNDFLPVGGLLNSCPVKQWNSAGTRSNAVKRRASQILKHRSIIGNTIPIRYLRTKSL